MNSRFHATRFTALAAALTVLASAVVPAEATTTAAQKQGQASVSATVPAECAITTQASALNFGIIDFQKTPSQRVQHSAPTGNLKLSCNAGTTYQLGVDQDGTTGSFSTAQTSNVQGTLHGQNDPSHTIDFVLNVFAGDTDTSASAKTVFTVSYNASLLLSQDPKVDTYSGHLVATIFV